MARLCWAKSFVLRINGQAARQHIGLSRTLGLELPKLSTQKLKEDLVVGLSVRMSMWAGSVDWKCLNEDISRVQLGLYGVEFNIILLTSISLNATNTRQAQRR